MLPRRVIEYVLRRSGGLCERKLPDGRRCLAPAADFHHIVPKRMGGRKGLFRKLFDDPRNIMAACRPCHDCASSWNEDAASLVPGAEYRQALEAGDVPAREL